MFAYPILPPEPDALSRQGIRWLAIGVAWGWAWIFSRGDTRRFVVLIACAAVVLIATGLLAGAGVLRHFDRVPPPLALAVGIPNGLALAYGLSRAGRAAAEEVPLAALVGLQAFRLPLELVMHHAARVGVMPEELSYSGYNFDIVTGAGALVILLLLLFRAPVPRLVVWAWNVWGMVCLAVIAVIAIASAPNVRAFGDVPRHVNTWVLYYPYVWLPTWLVPMAVLGHVVVTRNLLREGSRR